MIKAYIGQFGYDQNLDYLMFIQSHTLNLLGYDDFLQQLKDHQLPMNSEDLCVVTDNNNRLMVIFILVKKNGKISYSILIKFDKMNYKFESYNNDMARVFVYKGDNLECSLLYHYKSEYITHVEIRYGDQGDVMIQMPANILLPTNMKV